MKKLIGTIALLAMSMTSMNAQENGLYLSLNGGYNFAAGTIKGSAFDLVNKTKIVNLAGSSVETNENIALSLGKGLNFGGAIGYMFNKNVGAELGFDYLIGGKTTGSDSETRNSTNFNSSRKNDSEISAKMLQITPSLIISAGMEKINPYAKFGMIIGSAKITSNRNRTNTSTFGGSTATTNTFETSTELLTNTGVGFKGALGVMFTVNSNISVFAELTSINMSLNLKSGTKTKDTTNGVDNLIGKSINDTQTVYEDTLTTNSPTTVNPNEPSKEATVSVPFSSFGINVGLKYSF